MTDRTMREKAHKLADINSQIAALQAEADKLKGDITAEMEQRTVDELKAGSVLIRWKEVTSTRLDTKALREAHSTLYAEFARQQTTRRFTLVPA
jgi:predicted phage-related endonuclease